MKYIWDLEEIKNIVPECINFTEVLEYLKIPRQGNNIKTLKKMLNENNIDYSHFTGRARTYNKPNSSNIQDYLNNKIKISSFKLKNKLINEGLKENKCEICGIVEWQGKQINCQLHHIDGNHNNNNLNNLQILCPNCHSQTDNYCSSSNKLSNKNYCKDCGKEIGRGSMYCTICSHKHHRKVKDRPLKDQLLLDFKELKSIVKIGKKYKVSDNNIRKWLKSVGLPTKSSELKELL